MNPPCVFCGSRIIYECVECCRYHCLNYECKADRHDDFANVEEIAIKTVARSCPTCRAKPNLVSTSGRETLPVAERIALMRADLFTPPFAGVEPHVGRTETLAIHDLKLTIGCVWGTIAMYERAKALGTDDRVLSNTECLILAWRRGGFEEYKRVRRQQR